jgi:hypothetical protein
MTESDHEAIYRQALQRIASGALGRNDAPTIAAQALNQTGAYTTRQDQSISTKPILNILPPER